MNTILTQLKKETASILSDLGLKSTSRSVIGLDLGLKYFRSARTREDIKELKGLPLKDTLIRGIHELKDLAVQMAIASDEKISTNFTGGEVLIKRVSIPFMPAEEIKEALKWELKEELRFNIDKATIRFSILGHKETEDHVKKIELIAIVYKEEDIEAKVKELRDFGLNVQSVIPNEFALTAYINHLNIVPAKESAAIVDIGGIATTISVIEDRKLSFTRKLAIGGETITDAMTTILVCEKGRVGLSREEAERIKREQGISEDPRILSMMRPVLEKFVTQIKASLEYYEREFKCAPVKKIILAGNGARLKGLREYLSEEMGIEMLDVIPEIAMAVGLSLSAGLDINMLPEKFKEEKGRTLKGISLRMVYITVALMFLFSYALLSAKAINLNRELDIYRRHLDTLQDIRIMRDEMLMLGAAVNAISSEGMEAGRIMKELSNIVSHSVVLDSLAIKDVEPNIKLSGILKEEELSQFMSNLETSPLFEKVKLVFSEKNKDYSSGVLDFEIICNVK